MTDNKSDSDADPKPVRLRQPTPCPICKKTSTQKYHPFCTSHCANVDLGRWFNGKYTVPSQREENFGVEEPDDSV